MASSPGPWRISGARVLISIAGTGVVFEGRWGSSPAVPGVLGVHRFLSCHVVSHLGAAEFSIPVGYLHHRNT